MDHHALMWDEATRDLTAEATETALAHALADLSGVRDFTHLATQNTEYQHRVALTCEQVTAVSARWGVDPAYVQQELDTSFNHVQAARRDAETAARKTATAAAAQALTITAAIGTQDATAAPDTAPDAAPGAPADMLSADTTAKTSKPRTLPSGGTATAVPMPAPVAPGIVPGPSAPSGPAAPGAQAAPPHTASLQGRIEADIAALNPHLPAATVTRLAKNAMRHLAAEPLAYGNWDNAPDGPITNSVKNWSPSGHGSRNHGGGDGAGLSPDDGGGDTPAGPAAAGTAADAAAPAATALTDVLPLAAAAAAR